MGRLSRSMARTSPKSGKRRRALGATGAMGNP
jgi:hypothetical protein